jgi:predicted dehydrogenase
MMVAVLGLGVMGRNHIRAMRELTEVDEILGVDPDAASREEVARRYRIPTAHDVSVLRPGQIDAAVIAAPSSSHTGLAESLLRAGVPCLVEKPLATTVEECERIIAASRGTLGAVGHVERFNPAVLEMRRRLPEIGRVLAISTRRMGPYPARIRDVGVLLDLLTHDLDIVRYVTGAGVRDLRSMTNRFLGPLEDLVFAVGELDNGVAVSMEAGWLSPAKVREVRVIGERGTLLADTLLQELYLQENSIAEESWEALATFRGIGEGNVTRFAIRREEPLRVELRNFLARVRGEAGEVVSLADGCEAVRLALALRPVEVSR